MAEKWKSTAFSRTKRSRSTSQRAASTEVDFEPENGEMVCAADEMTAGVENGVLSVRVRNGENWNQVDIALRTAL